MKILLLIFTISSLVAVGQSQGLTLSGPKCGELYCARTQFCDTSDRCKDCSLICDNGHHNFDETMCTNSCQNYLHDISYIKNENLSPTDTRLEKKVNYLIGTCVILSLIILALLIPKIKLAQTYMTQKFQKNKISVQGEQNIKTNMLMPSDIQESNINQTQNTGSVVTSAHNNIITGTQRDAMAFTIANPAFTDNSEHESEHSNQTVTSVCHNNTRESQMPLQSSTPNDTPCSDRSYTQKRRQENGEIAINVRNLIRNTSSHCTIPDTPGTESTRVEDLYLGRTQRLPSEDCIVELRESNLSSGNAPQNIINGIQYNSPQRQEIYAGLPSVT